MNYITSGTLRTGTSSFARAARYHTNTIAVSDFTIDPFLGIFVATVIILEVKLKRPVRQFQASLTKLCALLQVVVQF